MKKPLIRIHDVENDQIIDREMTKDEYERYLVELKINDDELKAIATRKLAKEQLLEKLGITEEEAKLLLS